MNSSTLGSTLVLPNTSGRYRHWMSHQGKSENCWLHECGAMMDPRIKVDDADTSQDTSRVSKAVSDAAAGYTYEALPPHGA